MGHAEEDKEWLTLEEVSQILQLPYENVQQVVPILVHEGRIKAKKPALFGHHGEWLVHRDSLPAMYQRFYGAQVLQRARAQEQQNNSATVADLSARMHDDETL